MRVVINKKIGIIQYQFHVEVQDELEFFQKASFYANIPTKCGNCQCEDVHPDVRGTKKGDYYQIKCTQCHYEFKYGQYKAGGLFNKNEPWSPPYQPDGGGSQSNGPPAKGLPEPPPSFTEDDIPF